MISSLTISSNQIKDALIQIEDIKEHLINIQSSLVEESNKISHDNQLLIETIQSKDEVILELQNKINGIIAEQQKVDEITENDSTPSWWSRLKSSFVY